jgi:hypothetical protein
MKYIIPEQRFERLVMKYLSSLNLIDEKHDIAGFEVMHTNGKLDAFGGPMTTSRAMSYHSFTKKLFVSTELLSRINTLFGLEQTESLEYVKKWFQDQYNVKVKTLWLLLQ